MFLSSDIGNTIDTSASEILFVFKRKQLRQHMQRAWMFNLFQWTLSTSLFNALQKAGLKLSGCLSKLLLTCRKFYITVFKLIACLGPHPVEYACSAPSVIAGNSACRNNRQNKGLQELHFFYKCKIFLCFVLVYIKSFCKKRQSHQWHKKLVIMGNWVISFQCKLVFSSQFMSLTALNCEVTWYEFILDGMWPPFP